MQTTQTDPKVQALFGAGAHFGYMRSRRHPTALPFIFTTKNRSDFFDLEETNRRLEAAQEFIAQVASQGKQILFVGGKHEAVKAVRDAAEKADQPFVAGRWIGGTLTNFGQIRKRVDRMVRLTAERASGELDKYTKKERLLIGREIEELEGRFSGITEMHTLPAAVIVVDPRHESAAVKEAVRMNVPVIAIANTDCDFSSITYPIPANDSAVKSISFILSALAGAHRDAYRAAPAPKKNEGGAEGSEDGR